MNVLILCIFKHPYHNGSNKNEKLSIYISGWKKGGWKSNIGLHHIIEHGLDEASSSYPCLEVDFWALLKSYNRSDILIVVPFQLSSSSPLPSRKRVSPFQIVFDEFVPSVLSFQKKLSNIYKLFWVGPWCFWQHLDGSMVAHCWQVLIEYRVWPLCGWSSYKSNLLNTTPSILRYMFETSNFLAQNSLFYTTTTLDNAIFRIFVVSY